MGYLRLLALLDARTEMTSPLLDPKFFARCFIEAGALAWPNGFELSAISLYRRLRETGQLSEGAAAARGRDDMKAGKFCVGTRMLLEPDIE